MLDTILWTILSVSLILFLCSAAMRKVRPGSLGRVVAMLNFVGAMLLCFFLVAHSMMWGGPVLAVCTGFFSVLGLASRLIHHDFAAAKIIALVLLYVGAILTPRLVTEWRVHSVLDQPSPAISDQYYFATLVECFPQLSFNDSYRVNNPVQISAQRSPNNMWRISFKTDLNLSNRVTAGDVGKKAADESAWLMTLVLSHIISRSARVDRIDYQAAEPDNPAEYRSTISLENLASYKPRDTQGSVHDFVLSNMKVMKDTASGHVWVEYRTY